MFVSGGKKILCLIVLLYLNEYGGAAEISKLRTKSNLAERSFKLLSKIEKYEKLQVNTKFAVILSEFLIKQKVRFYESTRYEEQVYFNISHKLNSLKHHPADGLQEILDNLFQRNIVLIPPKMKRDHIYTQLDYKIIENNYEELVDFGQPNLVESDHCLGAIATLDDSCHLESSCLTYIASDVPTFGYHRTHQVLLLYALMHHKCSERFAPRAIYEKLAARSCMYIYREQNVIENMARSVPMLYRGLYLEQNLLCGLFGYAEFLNWRNLEVLLSWENEDGCYCEPAAGALDCNCSNHLNALALVYYINAFLLLV